MIFGSLSIFWLRIFELKMSSLGHNCIVRQEACMHACVCIHVYARMSGGSYVHVCVCVYLHVCDHVYVCVLSCVCVCLHVCLPLDTHINVFAYVPVCCICLNMCSVHVTLPHSFQYTNIHCIVFPLEEYSVISDFSQFQALLQWTFLHLCKSCSGLTYQWNPWVLLHRSLYHG